MPQNFLDIDPSNIIHNYQVLCKAAGVPVMAVLKANGYGLGGLYLANLLREQGCQNFAVSRLEEAEELRDGGVGERILLLTPTLVPEEARRIVSLGITASVGSLDAGRVLSKAATEADTETLFHLKLDTGFGRYGFLPEQLDEAMAVAQLPGMMLEGAYSHLATAFCTSANFTMQQKARFDQMTAALKNAGMLPLILHLASSCGALRYPSLAYDMIRAGTALTGFLPIQNKWGLRPATRLVSFLTDVRTLPKGHNVGYSQLYKTRKVTRIGVVSAGTYDGFSLINKPVIRSFRDVLRSLKNNSVAVMRRQGLTGYWEGHALPVLGRVSATSLVVDLGEHPCRPGDEISFMVNPILVRDTLPRSQRREERGQNM